MKVKYIDLFAGLGGIRLGLVAAGSKLDVKCECVFTSEIKPAAIKALNHNFPSDTVSGDITKISPHEIPDFDILLAGFPCQPFSYAGSSKGFADTRGTLFFNIEEILKHKEPTGFILENVEGLVSHDRVEKGKIGRTLQTILTKLNQLGYQTTWKVLDASDFGVPQKRKRVYIVGHKLTEIKLPEGNEIRRTAGEFLEEGLPVEKTLLTEKLLSLFTPFEIEGKRIKDKRGGDDNIHSWDLEIKGSVSESQKNLLNLMLKERRKKKWAIEHGIDWMDGMPLTLKQIETFINYKGLKKDLDDLVRKGYLRFEHPKKKITTFINPDVSFSNRIQDESLEKGYNIVSGKLSFEINEILSRNDYVRTLVASDMSRIYVYDRGSKGLRKLSRKECLLLSGYPNDYKSDFMISDSEFYDLIGNTVCVPVIEAIAHNLLIQMLEP
jgi:DNA (cytosine-5)-methyltransferase 1